MAIKIDTDTISEEVPIRSAYDANFKKNQSSLSHYIKILITLG